MYLRRIFRYSTKQYHNIRILQEPPENLNYFDIIGINKSYDVTIKEIHDKYRELQKLLHPDKFSTKTEREKEISASLSSLVNKAYSTLMHPLKRGFYLLELNNISVPEGTTNLNPEFLMEIMERNEEVENAKDDKDKIVRLLHENKEMLDTLTKDVTDAFKKEDIESAKAALIKMKYYDSIERRLKILKQDLGIVE
ncbi:hypothetical protein KM043_004464 [Ampulex compressa]|nr:hypothetical protein KM043_004464 [Ampulex compressa]